MQTVWSFISFHFIHLFSHIVKQSLQSNQEILSPSLKISIDALDLTCSDKLFQTVGDAKQKAGLAAFSLQNGNDSLLRVLERVVRCRERERVNYFNSIQIFISRAKE